MSELQVGGVQMNEDGPASLDISAVMNQFEKPLLHFAAAYVGKTGAQDVVQDVFIRLCAEPWDKVKNNLKGWLFVCCRNRAIDHQRKNRAALSDETLVDQKPGPESSASHKEHSELFLEAYQKLSEKKREVLSLRFSAGMSYDQIAEVTGSTNSNVGVTIHHAMHEIMEVIAAADRIKGERK